MYANPPLVEVIVELRWKLKALTLTPGGTLDPFFDEFSADLARRLKEDGYAFAEPLVPSEIPMEVLAHRVVRRFRRAENTWPVFQCGPGVFTANIVPPYDGWRAFSGIVRRGLDHVFAAYPVADKYLQPDGIQLKYIDAFTADHGFKSYSEFVRLLNVRAELPSISPPRSDAAKDMEAVMEFRLKTDSPVGVGVIKISPGISSGARALVMEMSLRSPYQDSANPAQAISWLNSAHKVVRGWFEGIVTPELERTFGQKTQISTH